PLDALDDVVGRPAVGVLVADAGDDVAAADTRAVGRRSLEERGDLDLLRRRVLHDADADAVVAPLLPLTHARELARREEARVRIERAEHAVDRRVDQHLAAADLSRSTHRGQRLDVLLLDGRERRRVDTHALVDAVLAVEGHGTRHGSQHAGSRQTGPERTRPKPDHVPYSSSAASRRRFLPNSQATPMLIT